MSGVNLLEFFEVQSSGVLHCTSPNERLRNVCSVVLIYLNPNADKEVERYILMTSHSFNHERRPPHHLRLSLRLIPHKRRKFICRVEVAGIDRPLR